MARSIIFLADLFTEVVGEVGIFLEMAPICIHCCFLYAALLQGW